MPSRLREQEKQRPSWGSGGCLVTSRNLKGPGGMSSGKNNRRGGQKGHTRGQVMKGPVSLKGLWF